MSHLDPLGLVFILVAGLFWALYILASERAGRKVEGAGGLAVAVTIAAVLVAPFGLSGAVPAVVADPSLLLLALPAALLASVIPYSLEFAALRRLPKPVFGILLSLEPAVAALAGFLLLGQGMSVLGACAVALVVAASIGSTLGARAPRKERVEVTAPAWACRPPVPRPQTARSLRNCRNLRAVPKRSGRLAFGEPAHPTRPRVVGPWTRRLAPVSLLRDSLSRRSHKLAGSPLQGARHGRHAAGRTRRDNAKCPGSLRGLSLVAVPGLDPVT
ncbi:EamA family transporter [Galactobacter valiniphilus]|uniref:EamA family transporter n=1 Tax=Galactobacter valiniphilus TaxID=2676122 RepID=UPI001F3464D1|nr:EamA family transporter [Galactobacter valiniphilus]